MILLAISTAVTALPSCKKQTAATSSGSEAVSFNYLLPNQYMNWMKDKAWYPELLKDTNATVTLEGGGDSDKYYQNVDLRVGSNGIKDAAIVKLAQAQVYGAQGAFLDLSPLINKYAPNIKKYLEKNPDYRKLITSDGKIYGLPQETPLTGEVTFYRADMFSKAGITELPKTMNDFTAALEKVKAANGSVQNFYPLTGRKSSDSQSFMTYAMAFNCTDQIDSKGKVHGIYNGQKGFDIYASGFKTMVQWYNTLYTKGLIDPEYVTESATEESWQTKMLTGKGAVSCDFFTRPAWFNTTGKSYDPNYDMKVMPMFQDTNGNTAKRYQTRYITTRTFVISKDSKNAVGVIKFLDYLFSEKGQNLVHYGVEGKTSQLVNGKYQFIFDYAKEAQKPSGTINYGLAQDQLTFPYPVDNTSYMEAMDEGTKSWAVDYFKKNYAYSKVLTYTDAQSQERTNLVAKERTKFDTEIADFVTGKRSFSTWDQFLADMKSVGYDRITEIDQAAYDAMQKNK